MPIVLLPKNIVNQIAAGEVVERPASVIKELVENSIDSNADKIDLQIRNAGKTMICIRDNGCGMNKEDLAMSVKRHATSKLSDLNLNNISSLGFRGEALATISSVSRMSVKSWTNEDESGWRLDIAGNENFSLAPVSGGLTGTYVEVSDLFFATPARLKFLKSDKAELAQCVDTFKRLALANHKIGFKLVTDNSLSLDLAKTDSLSQRIKDILGKQNFEDMCSVDSASESCKISGFCSIPTANSASAAHQYIFANGRSIKDKFLSSAIGAAYRDLIPMGRYANAVLFIEVNAVDIDVNVHPAKTEVRFRYGNEVKNHVIQAIKSAILPHSSKTSVSLGRGFVDKIINTKKTFSKPFSTGKCVNYDVEYNALPPQSFILNDVSVDKAIIRLQIDQAENNAVKTDDLLQNVCPALGNAIGQLFGRYIFAQAEDALVIVDQHAAHERLLYERFKNSANLIIQQLLVPEIVEAEAELVALAEESKVELAVIGFGIEKLDDNHLIVRYVPADIANNIQLLVKDILSVIKNEKMESFDQVLQEKVFNRLATFACHSSIKGGKHLSLEQMNNILRSIESNKNMGQCNHGRPSFVKIHLKDIERLFMR
ncbi:MAG: DNA mismatch repair endonuclease MutL [Holosporales bacterium]|jgi:DNA mismatch repair protein MutL|nr:DNA mismatch repair endonuclease MutL [Holosporales bacterium]